MFNCTYGTSYLLRDVFNMTLPVCILIDINSKGFSGYYLFYCVLREGLSINCDNFCLDAISINSVFVIFRVSLFICSISVLASVRLVSSAYILGSRCVRQCVKSLIYISKTEEVPKLFPGEHHILHISELTNLCSII